VQKNLKTVPKDRDLNFARRLKMPDIYARFYDAELAQQNGKPMGPVDRIVSIVSRLTHVELQFSPNFKSLSYSATTVGGYNCARFKLIRYSHLEQRWHTLVIPVTPLEEETIFFAACLRAGTPYDIIGVTSLATKLDIIKPDPNKTWCSKEVLIALKEALPIIGSNDVKPDEAYAQIELFIKSPNQAFKNKEKNYDQFNPQA